MANKSLFKSVESGPAADTVNAAGGAAYSLSDTHALAQYACTGTFGNTYYTNAKTQLETVLKLTRTVDSKFIAQCAVYARKQGHMKDMPAFLLAVLSARVKSTDKEVAEAAKKWLTAAWPKVIDNDRMLRNYVQIIRSGVTGRKSLGTLSKRLIQQWFDGRTPETIFKASIGESPSLKDIIRLAHVKTPDEVRKALQRYIMDYEPVEKNPAGYDLAQLPELVKQFEAFKKDTSNPIPNVPFQMLTSLALTEEHWKHMAIHGGWHFTRMNLNTFARHGVFKSHEHTAKIVEILKDKENVARSRVFPYQLLTAYLNTQHNADIPDKVKNALQDALELATKNVPAFEGNIVVVVDVSGSMSSPATGYRGSATSSTTCLQIAGLIAACVLRKATGTVNVVPVCTRVHSSVHLNSRDSVITNAQKLNLQGGGTALDVAFTHINNKKMPADTVIVVSDMESWASNGYGKTAMLREWRALKKRQPNAKLVNLDIQVATTTQVPDDRDVMNIGGFSDSVWPVIAAFVSGKDATGWVEHIKAIDLDN